MLKFFRNIGKSIYSPIFYQELEQRSTWLTLRYYLGVISLVAFLLGLGGTAVFGPMLTQFTSQATPVIQEIYPKDLVITIKSGTAASNIQSEEPYLIKMPKEMQEFLGATTTQNLAVINTKENADSNRFLALDAWILVAKDGIMVVQGTEDNMTTQLQPYTSDAVVTHDSYVAMVNKIASLGDKLPIVLLIVLIVAFFLWGVVRLLYFLVVALLVWLLLKARKLPATYGYAFRLSVHAATLPILLNFILVFVTGNIRTLAMLPFLFTIILLGVVWVNTKGTKPV